MQATSQPHPAAMAIRGTARGREHALWTLSALEREKRGIEHKTKRLSASLGKPVPFPLLTIIYPDQPRVPPARKRGHREIRQRQCASLSTCVPISRRAIEEKVNNSRVRHWEPATEWCCVVFQMYPRRKMVKLMVAEGVSRWAALPPSQLSRPEQQVACREGGLPSNGSPVLHFF